MVTTYADRARLKIHIEALKRSLSATSLAFSLSSNYPLASSQRIFETRDPQGLQLLATRMNILDEYDMKDGTYTPNRAGAGGDTKREGHVLEAGLEDSMKRSVGTRPLGIRLSLLPSMLSFVTLSPVACVPFTIDDITAIFLRGL